MTGQPSTARSFAVYPLPTPEDRLRFVVSSLNHAPRRAAHGATLGLIQSSVSTWLNILVPVLRTALRADGLVSSRMLNGLRTRIGRRRGVIGRVISASSAARSRKPTCACAPMPSVMP
jgi:hypothetical protein